MQKSFLKRLLPVATVGVVLGLTGCISATNSLSFANGEATSSMSLSAAAEYFTMNEEAESVLDGKEIKDMDEAQQLELCKIIRGDDNEDMGVMVQTDGIGEDGRLNCSYLNEPTSLDKIAEQNITATYDEENGTYAVSVVLDEIPTEGVEGVDKTQLKDLGVELFADFNFIGGVSDVKIDDVAITAENPVEGIAISDYGVTLDYMKVQSGTLSMVGYDEAPGGSATIVLVTVIGGIAALILAGWFLLVAKRKPGASATTDGGDTIVDGKPQSVPPTTDEVVVVEESPLPEVEEDSDPTPPEGRDEDGSTGSFLR